MPPSPGTVSKCLICLKNINLSCCSPDEAKCDESADLLYQIAKILKVSATIYDTVDLESLPGQLLCFSCNLRIFDALRLQQELALIEDKLLGLSDEIKNDFVQSCRQQNSKDEDSPGNELIQVEQIRRAYGQCWAQCEIGLKRCSSGPLALIHHNPRLHFPNLQFADWEGYHEGILDYKTLLDFEVESIIYDESIDLVKEINLEPSSESRGGVPNIVEDVFLCHLCGEFSGGKTELQQHLMKFHQLCDDTANDESSKEDGMELIPDSTFGGENICVPTSDVKEHRCRKGKKSKKRSECDQARGKRKHKKTVDSSAYSSNKTSKGDMPAIVQHSISSINNKSYSKTSGKSSSSKSEPPETVVKSARKKRKRGEPGEGAPRSKKTFDVRSTICPVCGRNLERKSDLQRHMKDMHQLRSNSRISW
ncbi:unnamed protein product [Allacma fusca]|uniref:C2H2-type domain-containing protein n=1 Tax=Allacma fusca TaxID=39272 RepID=A0A8J2J0A9_9HEXA|nr:unnamed protein product [Allacma fusca]